MPSILETGMAQVQKDLEALPPDTKGAFVGTIDTHGRISVGMATKVGDTWSVSGQVKFKLEKTKPDGYFGVMKTWK